MAREELLRNLGSVSAVLLLLLGYALSKDRRVLCLTYAYHSLLPYQPAHKRLKNRLGLCLFFGWSKQGSIIILQIGDKK